MSDCICTKIVDEINDKFPNCDWNLDQACDAWQEMSSEIEDNNIQFEPYSDECFACTCPACGAFICGWCV